MSETFDAKRAAWLAANKIETSAMFVEAHTGPTRRDHIMAHRYGATDVYIKKCSEEMVAKERLAVASADADAAFAEYMAVQPSVGW